MIDNSGGTININGGVWTIELTGNDDGRINLNGGAQATITVHSNANGDINANEGSSGTIIVVLGAEYGSVNLNDGAQDTWTIDDGDQCADSPCDNGANCVDGVFRFSCECDGTGLAGPTCGTPLAIPASAGELLAAQSMAANVHGAWVAAMKEAMSDICDAGDDSFCDFATVSGPSVDAGDSHELETCDLTVDDCPRFCVDDFVYNPTLTAASFYTNVSFTAPDDMSFDFVLPGGALWSNPGHFRANNSGTVTVDPATCDIYFFEPTNSGEFDVSGVSTTSLFIDVSNNVADASKSLRFYGGTSYIFGGSNSGAGPIQFQNLQALVVSALDNSGVVDIRSTVQATMTDIENTGSVAITGSTVSMLDVHNLGDVSIEDSSVSLYNVACAGGEIDVSSSTTVWYNGSISDGASLLVSDTTASVDGVHVLSGAVLSASRGTMLTLTNSVNSGGLNLYGDTVIRADGVINHGSVHVDGGVGHNVNLTENSGSILVTSAGVTGRLQVAHNHGTLDLNDGGLTIMIDNSGGTININGGVWTIELTGNDDGRINLNGGAQATITVHSNANGDINANEGSSGTIIVVLGAEYGSVNLNDGAQDTWTIDDGDQCADSPCDNGANCVDGVFRFSCECDGTGLAGPTCGTPLAIPASAGELLAAQSMAANVHGAWVAAMKEAMSDICDAGDDSFCDFATVSGPSVDAGDSHELETCDLTVDDCPRFCVDDFVYNPTLTAASFYTNVSFTAPDDMSFDFVLPGGALWSNPGHFRANNSGTVTVDPATCDIYFFEPTNSGEFDVSGVSTTSLFIDVSNNVADASKSLRFYGGTSYIFGGSNSGAGPIQFQNLQALVVSALDNSGVVDIRSTVQATMTDIENTGSVAITGSTVSMLAVNNGGDVSATTSRLSWYGGSSESIVSLDDCEAVARDVTFASRSVVNVTDSNLLVGSALNLGKMDVVDSNLTVSDFENRGVVTIRQGTFNGVRLTNIGTIDLTATNITASVGNNKGTIMAADIGSAAVTIDVNEGLLVATSSRGPIHLTVFNNTRGTIDASAPGLTGSVTVMADSQGTVLHNDNVDVIVVGVADVVLSQAITFVGVDAETLNSEKAKRALTLAIALSIGVEEWQVRINSVSSIIVGNNRLRARALSSATGVKVDYDVRFQSTSTVETKATTVKAAMDMLVQDPSGASAAILIEAVVLEAGIDPQTLQLSASSPNVDGNLLTVTDDADDTQSGSDETSQSGSESDSDPFAGPTGQPPSPPEEAFGAVTIAAVGGGSLVCLAGVAFVVYKQRENKRARAKVLASPASGQPAQSQTNPAHTALEVYNARMKETGATGIELASSRQQT